MRHHFFSPVHLVVSKVTLVILSGAARVTRGQVSCAAPSSLHGLRVLVANESQRDLRVPRRGLLRAPEVDLLTATHDHGEVDPAALVLHAVHGGHALEPELLDSGAPRGARRIARGAASSSFAGVQAQSVLGEHAALLLPQLQEPAAALLQLTVPHHSDRKGHGRTSTRDKEELKGNLKSWCSCGASQDVSKYTSSALVSLAFERVTEQYLCFQWLTLICVSTHYA